MDATTTKEEVVEALEKVLEEKSDFKLSELRPNRGGTQAVTITINQKGAEQLNKHELIKVRLLRCSIQKRINLKRCFKCWSYEHEINKCDRPDRSNHCRKCGRVGHKSENCKEDETCLLCNETGHISGSGKCKAFKKALSVAKKQKKLKQQRM